MQLRLQHINNVIALIYIIVMHEDSFQSFHIKIVVLGFILNLNPMHPKNSVPIQQNCIANYVFARGLRLLLTCHKYLLNSSVRNSASGRSGSTRDSHPGEPKSKL